VRDVKKKVRKGGREGGREGGRAIAHLLYESLEKTWDVLPLTLVDITLHLVGGEGGREGGQVK